MNDKRPRAFALEPTRNQDLSSAEDFGELVYLFPADGTRPSIWSEEFAECVARSLDTYRFDPKSDLIVVAGQMVPLAITIATVVSKWGPTSALLYSSTDRRYVKRTLGGQQ